MDDWGEAIDLDQMTVEMFRLPGTVFTTGEATYRTTGEAIGEGGMGVALLLERRVPGRADSRAVAKLYWDELLARVGRDPIAQKHFEHNTEVLRRLSRIDDIHLMPIYCAHAIGENFLIISPFLGQPLTTVIDEEMSPRERVGLVLQAVRGLRTLHEHGVVHSDFTPHNILVGDPREHAAVLFDFDLSVAVDLIDGASYHEHYQGRIVGSPEFSLVPELLDPVLVRVPVSPLRDLYAVGTTLYSMFTDVSIYGDSPDLATLLRKIADGVVRGGVATFDFPDEIPRPLRAVITRCLERDPAQRYPDTQALVHDLERAHAQLSTRNRSRFRTTLTYVHGERTVGLKAVIEERSDPTVTPEEIRLAQSALQRQGYIVERSLGRVKGHPIYVAAPEPTLVLTGRFNGPNTYRKIVTAIDLGARPDGDTLAADWLERIGPVLAQVRTEHLTPLHRVAVDEPTARLLLFSEYLDDVRFGTDLAQCELELHEALALGVIAADQVARLHEHGLAHGNVGLEALLFKGFAADAECSPLLVGLVEPTFEPADRLRDVQRLAAMVCELLPPSVSAEATGGFARVATELDNIAHGVAAVPSIAGLAERIRRALGHLDDNFAVLCEHAGDPVAYARLLVRHTLYRRLWSPR
ncbi:MAG TPA: protein kinase [Kofleriaceae bacterium]|nr:protein kinase [Kofleriaceae bacterium]